MWKTPAGLTLEKLKDESKFPLPAQLLSGSEDTGDKVLRSEMITVEKRP